MLFRSANDNAEEKSLAPTLKAMTEIVQTLRANNPRMVILIGEPYPEWKPFPEMSKAYAVLAKSLSTPESPVVSVNHSAGWVSHPDQNGTCTVDWVHPNPIGDEKIAANFFKALLPWVKPASD